MFDRKTNVRYLRIVAEPRADAIFGPEDISVMVSALDRSWNALAFAQWENERDMVLTRERLARSIVKAAALGERRVPTLSSTALGTLEPRRAGANPWRAKSVL